MKSKANGMYVVGFWRVWGLGFWRVWGLALFALRPRPSQRENDKGAQAVARPMG